MSERFQKTKPSFLEAGMPCASLSAECQRDNNAFTTTTKPPSHLVGAPATDYLPRSYSGRIAASRLAAKRIHYPSYGR